MTVELWVGREFERTNEMRFLGQFVSRMSELHSQDEELYLILANFFCQGEEIDLAVLKPNALLIIELKDASGVVRIQGGENGAWTATNPDGSQWQMNDGRRRNPFQQLRTYRYAMKERLEQDAAKFLRSPRREQMRFDLIDTYVALCPTKSPQADIQVAPNKWFTVIGLDELPREVLYARSPLLSFSEPELRTLVRLWSLRPYLIERFLTSLPVSAAPSNQTTPTDTSVHDQKHVQPQIANVQAPANNPESLAAGPSVPIPPSAPCVVCNYAPQACQVSSFSGVIIRALENTTDTSCAGELEMLDEAGSHVRLTLLDQSWCKLLPLVQRAINQEGDSHLKLLAYHLARDGKALVAGLQSLVILQPDWLIDVTDLTKVEYCPRQYLADRFSRPTITEPQVRGTIAHRVFEQIALTPTDDAAIASSLQRALREQVRALAVCAQTTQTLRGHIMPHCDRLKRWVIQEHFPGKVRSETFMLTPELGLKGKIDAVWSDDSGALLIGELKTGQSYGDKSRPGHAFQAGAYSLMCLVRGWSRLSGTVAVILYTGNEDNWGGLNIRRPVPLDSEKFRDIVQQRNLLVLVDYLADSPFETTQPNKCRKCAIARECEEVSVLLRHADPRPADLQNRFGLRSSYGIAEQSWFQAYTRLLSKEYRFVKDGHTFMWRKSVEERRRDGTTVWVTGYRERSGDPTTGRHTYLLETKDRSELREEDFVLVSDSEGPIRGVIAGGVVKRPVENGLEIEFASTMPKAFQPRIVDRYVSEKLVERQFVGLSAWLNQPKEQRDLVVRHRKPRFITSDAKPRFRPAVGQRDLNQKQQEAVRKVLRMEDGILVQGPPGSGKTILVPAIVRELLADGKRVLLAAGTNTAVDNMVRELKDGDLGNHCVRLGSTTRTHLAASDLTLDALAKHEDIDVCIAQTRSVLTNRPVVAATAATWLSEDWGELLKFDVAIVDEAAQLTVPATLGVLSLARQFILVGDHKQLPSVVLSEADRNPECSQSKNEYRLSESLFERLMVDWKDACPEAIVTLNEQYRMNERICAIPRDIWYESDLRPASTSIASAKLHLAPHNFSSVRGLVSEILDPEQSVVFVDVPQAQQGEMPRTNNREARLVSEIVQAYLICGGDPSRMGIIAPFRAQVAAIRRALETDLPEQESAFKDVVDTVDRFQGQERELIIVSLSSYGDFIHKLLLDERRLNVALTRAKHKLIILGDGEVLATNPTYSAVIHHCRVVSAR